MLCLCSVTTLERATLATPMKPVTNRSRMQDYATSKLTLGSCVSGSKSHKKKKKHKHEKHLRTEHVDRNS